jgi:signal transduction histidine kinase
MHALQAVAEPRSVDLNELVKSVTSVFADVAVGFSPTYPGTRIIGSAFHIQNALLELLSNARDFTHHLGPSAAIRVWIDSQGDMHHIHVVDNGPGVLPTLGDSIFDLFVTSVEKRTGMGLAYVKQVALAYAGKVQYLSGDNGAHFVLSFPKLGMPTE